MSDETRRVLDLLAQGRITPDAADRLLRAIGAPPPTPDASTANATASGAAPSGASGAKNPRYIRIAVHKPSASGNRPDNVNIRVPIAIVKGGMRLGALLPGVVGEKVTSRLRERGLDLDLSRLDPAAVDVVMRELTEAGIDVDAGNAQVRITCE